MRRSEITSLEWKNLNLNKKTILIPVTKNGEAREVPLSEIALTQILQMNRTQERIFNITSHAITIAFGRACKRAGVNGLPFHALRHEAISRFFEGGFSLAEVALISGHKTWSMLRRYTHLKAEDLAKKMG
jgi:integrase